MNYKKDDHEHDRFLFERDGFLHFGCINPFCGHGDPALPKHYRIPMETEGFSLRVFSHIERMLILEIALKNDITGFSSGGEFVTMFRAGEVIKMFSNDNLDACSTEFDKKFGTGKGKR